MDDKPLNRTILLDMLGSVGFETHEAENGQEAVTKALECRPDIVFMDLVMPVMDGFEATRQIRRVPELKDTIVIASSASVFEFNRKDSLAAGCNDFVDKPIRAEDLFEKLRKHLGLEWVYESGSAAETQPGARESSMVPPPHDELVVLMGLAKKGKIVAIRDRIAKVEELGSSYQPFAAELRRLAKTFDMNQVKNFLTPYLEEKK